VEGRVSTQTLANAPSTVRQGWAEIALAGLVLAGLALVAWRFFQHGYLPQPFYYHVSRSLLDLHSTAFWAHARGAFSQWRSQYPPLSFIFLRLTSLKSCYGLGYLAGRDCDWLARLVLVTIYIANGILVYAAYRLSDPRTAMPRAIALGLGLPMLYALERGNLLIPCFTCFVLGYSDLTRRRWLRCLALAAAINFKPYLVFVALPLIVKRRWASLAWVIGLGGAVYLATALWYGSGWPLQMIANETQYAGAASKSYFADLYYATDYWPLIRLLHGFPAGLRLGPEGLSQAWSVGLTVLLRVTQAAALALVGFAMLRSRGVDVRRLGALVAVGAITAYTTGSAGYAQIFLFFLVFYEPWRGPTRIVVLLATYLLCIPVDYVILPVIHGQDYSWLGGREVTAVFGVSVGQLVRPALLLVIQTGLIVLNLQDIVGGGEGARGPHNHRLTCPAQPAGLPGSLPIPTPMAKKDQA
jgi:hypothetical protein